MSCEDPQDSNELRSRAEDRIAEGSAASAPVPTQDTQRLIHELQVHQTELEIQNEELRRAQLELEAARDQYEDLYNFAPTGYLSISREGLIVHANLKAAEMLGIVRSSLIDRLFSSFVLEEDRWQFYEHRRQALASGTLCHCDLRLQPAKGPMLHVNMQSILEGEENLPRLMRTALIDITMRKRFEQALRESEARLREANETLESRVLEETKHVRMLERQRSALEQLAATGRVAARVAHEINNPLAGIKNAFLLIKDSIPPDHKYADYVPRIQTEIDRIAGIIKQMYQLVRPPEDEAPNAALGATVQDVAALQELACRNRGITLDVYIDPGCERVPVSGNLVRQILYNLLQNAMDATPEGRTVRMRANCVDKGELDIAVDDSGPGIPEERQPYLFEPFYTTKEIHSNSGLGLGLSISKSLAESIGGRLQFTSVLGKGTTFTLTLPSVHPNTP